MQVFDDINDAVTRNLHTVADLISRHTDDRDIDRRLLSQCDEELGELQSIQKRLERRVALVSRKRNTFAPINILPHELLATMLKIVVGHEDDPIRFNQETLVLVCHYWNHFVNHTPSLWTKIRKTSKTSNTSVIRALKKSRGYPLEITYTHISRKDEREFLSTILPHAHRWRKATLSLGVRTDSLKSMVNLSAPLLESFSLRVGFRYGDEAEPINIFGGRPPATLQEVFLAVVPVPWTPATFRNLKILSIASYETGAPSLDQLFAILSASPDLNSLFIQNVWFSGATGVPFPNPTHMSALGRISLEEISPIAANRILAAVDAPNCKSGSLKATVRGDPFETLFTPDVCHFFHHIRSGANASSIRASSYGPAQISWEGPWNITLEVENVRVARRVLGWLSVSPEPNSSAVPLHLSINHNATSVEDILPLMADLDVMDRITFYNRTPVAGALRMITAGSAAERGTGQLFPVLKDIQIFKSMDDDEWESLLRMLHGRQGGTGGRDGDQSLKPLQKLELHDDFSWEEEEEVVSKFTSTYWPNRLEVVRRLLGPEGKLVWCSRTVTEDGVLGDPEIPRPPLTIVGQPSSTIQP